MKHKFNLFKCVHSVKLIYIMFCIYALDYQTIGPKHTRNIPPSWLSSIYNIWQWLIILSFCFTFVHLIARVRFIGVSRTHGCLNIQFVGINRIYCCIPASYTIYIFNSNDIDYALIIFHMRFLIWAHTNWNTKSKTNRNGNQLKNTTL